jgi:hypothetical protein
MAQKDLKKTPVVMAQKELKPSCCIGSKRS